MARYDPRNLAAWTTLGEIHADPEQFDRARAYWNRIPEVEPGQPGGYFESATVFWDYYQVDDALRMIAQGRTKLNAPALYAYEAGAIYEGLRQPDRAIACSRHFRCLSSVTIVRRTRLWRRRSRTTR